MIGPIVAALLAALPPGLDDHDVVEMEGGVAFVGLVAPAEATIGGRFDVELVYRLPGPMPAETWSFLHLESLDSACRVVQDKPLDYGTPPLADGYLHQRVTVTVPATDDCKPTRLEIYTGLYGRESGRRVPVLKPSSLDDRVHAGSVELVAGEADIVPVATPPSTMGGAEFWSHVRPWLGWLGALAVTTLGAWFFARRLRKRPLTELDPDQLATDWVGDSRQRRLLRSAIIIAVLAVPVLLSLLAARDFVKDDAYISFRYAHNLVTGHGLVFNPGDRVEGISNFLWTLLMAPFEGLGLDLFQVCEVIGTALVCGLIVFLTKTLALIVHADGGPEPIRTGAWLWGGLWLGTSSSLALWATSGMEQALAMFLPMLAAYLLWKKPLAENRKAVFWSGVVMGLGCMTRPELHFIGLCIGLPVAWQLAVTLVRQRKVDTTALLWFAGLFLVLVPFHAFRLAYYGGLFPNTFYVKTGASSLVMLEGLKKLREMFDFNATGILLVLAPFAFIRRERRTEKLVALAIALGFMFYIVKVGVDEMQWHRLYLPALPFLVLLAASGLANVCRCIAAWVPFPGRRAVTWGLAWIAVVAATVADFSFTYRSQGGFNGRGDLSGNFHPDVGKFITRHDRPGALVAFQDMGSTPYHAPDIDFLDFIGLVDSTIAHRRYDYGLHAFLATESAKNQPAFDTEMRQYFYSKNPEWTILTTYIPDNKQTQDAVTARFQRDPGPKALADYIGKNGYQFGLWDDGIFQTKYVHVRTWPRSAGYYLSLFRRKDLWDQTPREVVLDAPPPGIGGVKAHFSRGLELLGSDIAPTAKATQEAFMTTWWKLPGPLEPDTWFFLHVESDTFRAPFDSLPGDSMWPADRWQAGQIMEHRVLFQVPPDMPPGTYKVYLGVYRRSNGLRLDVADTDPPSAKADQSRVYLGDLTIEALNTPFDTLIKRCDPAEQRKYPDRIMDSGRPPRTD